MGGTKPEDAKHVVEIWSSGLKEKTKTDSSSDSAASRIMKLTDDPLIRKYTELFLKRLYCRHYT